MMFCFVKYARGCQFSNEIGIFRKWISFFALFQLPITSFLLTLQRKTMLFLKYLYQYFNFKWLFDVANEIKFLAWHTYMKCRKNTYLRSTSVFHWWRLGKAVRVTLWPFGKSQIPDRVQILLCLYTVLTSDRHYHLDIFCNVHHQASVKRVR